MWVRRRKFGAGIRSIAANGLLLMASSWVEAALRMLYAVALARYLGAELYGIWAYAAASYTLITALSGFGLEMLVPIRLGADRSGAPSFVGVSLTLRLGLLGVAAVGLVAYAAFAEPNSTARLALLLAIPALFGKGLSMWARTVFLGFERVGAYVMVSAVARSIEVIAGVALLASGAGLVAIVSLHSAVWITDAGIALALIHRLLVPYRLRFDRNEISGLFRQGSTIALSTMLTHWLNAGPLVLLRHVQDDMELLGQFGLAFQVGFIAFASAQPFVASALPVLSRSAGRGDPRIASYGSLTAVTALLVFGAMAAVAFKVGPMVAVRLFGSEFATAGELLGPSLLIAGLMLAPLGYYQMLILRGCRRPTVIAGLAGGLVLLAALPPATVVWGVHGAVFATGGAWLARGSYLAVCGARRQRLRRT